MAILHSDVSLFETLESQVANGNHNSALNLIHRVVDKVGCEPLAVAEIFGSILLDDYCQKIGAANLRRVCGSSQVKPGVGDFGSKVVYVVSRLYASGGHTAVLADIIRLSPHSKNVLLLTGTTGPTDLDAVRNRFDGIDAITFEYSSGGTHLERLDWLQRRLCELAPKTVWLFNHHQDSVAVAAVQPNGGYQLRFYHHGDHHMCLGVHLSYADHVDPHPMGFHNCREELGIKNNLYLPLVVKDQGRRKNEDTYNASQGLVTCTAARSNKITPPYFIRYVDVVPELLRISGGKHIHIGHLSWLTLFKIRCKLLIFGLPKDSFVYIPFVPNLWQALHEHMVDLYVTSFPYGGGRTLIEVMGAGVAVAPHIHSFSRLLSAFDMAYDSALYWRTPQQLYDHVRRIDAEGLELQGRAARSKYEESYREEVLEGALANWEMPLLPPPLLEGYSSDGLQQALEICSQISCTGVISRLYCRMLRLLKSLRG